MAISQEFIIKFKEETENITSSTLNYIIELHSEVGKKSEIIYNKNIEIDRLGEEITKLEEELNKIRVLYFLRNKEVQLMKEETTRLKTFLNKREMITSIENAFEYPVDIVTEYLYKLDWESYTSKDLMRLFEVLLDYKNHQLADFTIEKLCTYKLWHFTKVDLSHILKLFSRYLNTQINENIYFVNGIYSFLIEINKNGWTTLIKDFVKEKYEQLEKIADNIDDKKLKVILSLEVLKTLFILKNTLLTKKLLEKILLEYYSFDADIDVITICDLMYIMVYYNKEQELLSKFNSVQNIVGLEVSEIKCLKHYLDGMNNTYLAKSSISQIQVLKSKCNNINHKIKETVVQIMIDKLNKEIEKEQSMLIHTDNRININESKNNIIYLKDIIQSNKTDILREIENTILNHHTIKNTQLRYININISTLVKYVNNIHDKQYDEEVIKYVIKEYFSHSYYIDESGKGKLKGISETKILKKNLNESNRKEEKVYLQSINIIYDCQKKCFCGNSLSNQTVYIRTNSSMHITTNALYCNKCNKYYMTKTAFKYTNLDLYIKSQTVYPNNKITPEEFYSLTNNKYEGLKQESFLHLLGYNVSDKNLIKKDRLAILDDAVEYFGIEKVEKHIKYLIEDRSNQKNGVIRYSSALGIWKCDLKYLRENYF